MADIIDEANDLTDLNMQLALANRHIPLQPTGFCRNCDEPISAGHFCDAECRADFDKRARNNHGR